MEILTQVHEKNLVAWAKDKPEVVVFSGDLTGSTEITLFKKTYPDRFFSLGMAEQNMMSFAGGMARDGFTPFVHTFAVFMYRRALDQIEMSIAYPNQRVRMFGFLPGIMTPGGVSHQAINDVGVLRTLPNMTVLETGDATDVESVLDVAQAVDGPVYIRMVRKDIPRLFPASERMQLGKARILSRGTDIALVTAGICTEEAMRATALLEKQGVSISHIHVTTHKPFNDPAVAERLAAARFGVITMENHTTVGGLGSEVAEMMAETGVSTRLTRLGIPDTYAHGASKEYLVKEYGLDAISLVRAVEGVMNQKFGISEEALADVRLSEFTGEMQLEAL
ncbi:MAG: transketolase [Spirochaetaceae bacterium]|nr:MAG: transketolase [Spirochaetaceae bacterium]